MSRRNIPREIRDIVPAVVREDLAAAGFMIVETRTVTSLRTRLESLTDDLTRYPNSQVARDCLTKALSSLAMTDHLLGDD